MSDANVILTFRDEQGREWLAAAHVGPLLSSGDDSDEMRLEVEELKDRAFTLHGIKVIDSSWPQMNLIQ